ncbi:MAG: D-alanyl-D-alanine carboxypeptidase [Pelotomaculum sp. PtaB.Bin104]|nr:MAG: D-alanyl-D-alanine carboxypeptidase [Pelotomaculum sp. PtaB.Bin104]
MKKLFTLLLTIILIMVFYTKAYPAPENRAVFQLGSDKYSVNSQEQVMDTISFLHNNRVFVPVRYLAYACGIGDQDILWDPGTQTITLKLNNKRLLLQAGSSQLVINRRPVDMDTAPLMMADRVFLPARWIAEACNYQVEWDQNSKAVLIYPPGEIKPLPPEQPAVLLVNKNNVLPDDYQPGALDDFNGQLVASALKDPLRTIFTAAGAQGIKLGLNSGYRDAKSQKIIFNERVSQLGLKQARSLAALPGYSEHQTGLAVDLEGDSRAYAWLKANCWSYGFILRYPQGAEQITGYAYEPWHFRYVGRPIASFMQANDLQTLEEFMDTYIGD